MPFGTINDLIGLEIVIFLNFISIHSVVVELQTCKIYCFKPRPNAYYKTWELEFFLTKSYSLSIISLFIISHDINMHI
jgi:hypothetical protein